MGERDHHSIGEVLALIQEDFPDVTISKIRFLESQGLLDPDRTRSGYRKFYDEDVERLRWVLHQQRENYLPLKVIKDRLERHLAAGELPPAVPSPSSAARPQPARAASDDDGRGPARSAAAGDGPAATAPPERPPDPEPAPTPPRSAAAPDPMDPGPTSVSMTGEELAAACGIDVGDVEELRRFGLVTARTIGSADLFDAEALAIARLATPFLQRGIEARHLKMYKVAADREAGFLEQLVGPLMGHRDPSTRAQAGTEVRSLIEMGDKLRAALLRRSVNEQLGPT